MFYAILLTMSCTGFQCDIHVVSQYRADSFEVVESQCEENLKENIGDNCMYYFEELYISNEEY